MSYILDALNKSENERRAGRLAGAAAGASFMVAPQKAARRGGTALLVGAGMLATGLALGAWHPWQPAAVVTPPPAPLAAAAVPPAEPPASTRAGNSSSPAKATPKAVAQAKPQPQPQPTMPAAGKRAPAKATVVADAAEAGEAADAPAKRVVSYGELPAKVKGKLPNVTFGGYAGVDESEVRIAFINNRLVKEGEEVSPGLRLEKVSGDSVVLAFQGHRFRP